MKVRYTLEYPMNCSPLVLYPRLSSPSGLSEWFANDVNIEGRYYIFIWQDSSQKAEVISRKENNYIRFHWVDDGKLGTYFEFRIIMDELTGEFSLVITDFAEETEKKEAVELWNSQVAILKHCVGA